MEIRHTGVGNLADKPKLKTVEIDGEERHVAVMRVYFDRLRRRDEEFVDEGGFWRDVAIWNEALGTRAVKLLDKGARVFVAGEVKASKYRRDGEEFDRESYTINADYIALDTIGIESVRRLGKASDAVAA